MQVVYHTDIRFIGTYPLLVILDKRCTYCLQFKDFDAFGNQTHAQCGLLPYCKECWVKRTREKRAQELGVPVSQVAKKKFPPAKPGYKYCFSCEKEKPFQAFHRKSKSPDGYSSHCKDCRNGHSRNVYVTIPEEQRKVVRRQKYVNNRERSLGHSRKYLAKHPEKKVGYQRKYRANHPDVYRNYQQRRRAVIQRVSPQGYIDYRTILERDGWQCHICSYPIDPTIKNGPAGLVFDHIIPLHPRKGEPQGTHESSNICPCHRICNSRKNNRPMWALTEHDRRGPRLH